MLDASVREQPLVGLAVGVALTAFERDDAEDPIAGEDRDAEPRLREDLVADEAVPFHLLERREAQRPARGDHVRGQAVADWSGLGMGRAGRRR